MTIVTQKVYRRVVLASTLLVLFCGWSGQVLGQTSKIQTQKDAVIARNPQAAQNFRNQVQNVQTTLVRLSNSLIWVDGIPYFAYTSNARALGIQVKGAKVVGPDGQIGIMNGRGSAVKYSSQTQAEVSESGKYAATIYIPFNKIPLLSKNASWNTTSLVLAYRVERKVEDIVLSEVIYMNRPTGGKSFTYAQVLQRDRAMVQAVAEYRENLAQQEEERRIGARMRFCISMTGSAFC